MFRSSKYLKVSQVALTAVLAGITLSGLSCAPRASTSSQNQLATVQRGDLSIDITATGNLAFSEKEVLSFEMRGTVAEVLVEEGDAVTEGQVLVRIDASAGSEWQEQLNALEDKIAAAENQVTAAERQVTTRERDLLQAQINLQSAQNAVDTTQQVLEATDNVTQAEYDLKLARALLEDARLFNDPSISYRQLQVNQAQTKLNEARQILADVQAANRISTSTDMVIKRLQVELAQAKVEDAQKAIEDARESVEDARNAVTEAEEAWEEAKAYKTELAAPFAGLITRMSVSSGDVVQKGAAVVEVASDAQFYADVLVSETDIAQVTADSQALVQVEAMPSLSLLARVTRIAPAATIQQGVVNYKVKVEVQSIPRVLTGQSPATGNASAGRLGAGNLFGRFGASGNMTAGQLPEQWRQALRDRGLTQEQVEEMMRDRMQGLPGVGGTIQLREGMTVTVTITVEQRSNVLVVPNRAITRQGGQYLVKVPTDGGAIESRPVQVGINDSQYTEVTAGLSEGEQVVVSQSTATNSGTSSQRGQQRFMIPGGGMLR